MGTFRANKHPQPLDRRVRAKPRDFRRLEKR